MIINGKLGEYFELLVLNKTDFKRIKSNIESSLSILWFQDDKSQIEIDGKIYNFLKNEILFLTEFHKVEINKIGIVQYIRFNRSFFCIVDHDKDIGCKGVLFFGSSNIPLIKIPTNEIRKFEGFWNMFLLEFEEVDKFQIDMIQTMLKRYIILCTRVFIDQNNVKNAGDSNLVREFNYLVEQHFRIRHRVSDYASLLNKSPKTLSNIFNKQTSKTPLQFIQERRLLEAKRLLGYSDYQIQEIAYEIGFEDSHSFSRFFKNKVGLSPLSFRGNIKKG